MSGLSPCPPLPEELGALLVELRDRQDPLLRPVLHRAAQLGWPVAVLAPVLGVSPGALRSHIAVVDGYDPETLPPVPAPDRPPAAVRRLPRRPRIVRPAADNTNVPAASLSARSPHPESDPRAVTVLVLPPRRQGVRRDIAAVAVELRAAGHCWADIAAALRARYGVNPLAACRLAHGWSQTDTAAVWTRRWPGDLKRGKAISLWESWSAGNPAGSAPTVATLRRLAELYECAIGDLLGEIGDYRHLDRPGPGEWVDDRHFQYAIGQTCPHGCTVFAYPPAAFTCSAEPAYVDDRRKRWRI